MQQFKGKFQNSPIVAPQDGCSENPILNKVEKLRIQDKVRPLNNLGVDQLQHKGGPGLRVPAIAYVLNMRGKPLMPCSARKARILLKKGEAQVVKTNPFFIIQMTKATGEQVQVCSLGIDSGSKVIIFSADQKTSQRLIEKKMYRRPIFLGQKHRNNRILQYNKGGSL